MNSQNENHFSKKLNAQVGDLLQVLTEISIERCFEK